MYDAAVVGHDRYRVRAILAALASALCLALILSACGGGSAGSEIANKDLRLAVSFLPSSADASYTFEFGDWGPIEQELGYSAHRLASPHGDAAFTQKLQRLTGGSPGGNTSYDLEPKGVPDTWTIADVLWDASEFSIGPGATAPVSITGFRDASVIPRVEQHLTKCGFHSRTVGGMALYTGVALKCVSPLGTGIPATYNAYAFDTADRLVVQSASSTAATAAIANHQHHRSNSVLNSILSRMGNVTQAAVGLGPAFCSQLSNPAALAGRVSSPSKVARAEHVFGDTTRYLGFGFGYQYAAGGVSGRLVFVYPSDSVARSDLNRRAQMLRTGIAFSAGVPYSKLFQLRSAQTKGAATIYQLAQPGGGALALGSAFDRLDIGFARC